MYFAKIKVENESGSPCQDAKLYFGLNPSYDEAHFDADSLGVIIAFHHSYISSETFSLEIVIYKYGYLGEETPYWLGEIKYQRSKVFGYDLDPFIVVFPDEP